MAEDNSNLNFKFGDFCVLIWDKGNVGFEDAVASLNTLSKLESPVYEGWDSFQYRETILKAAANMYGDPDYSNNIENSLIVLSLCQSYLKYQNINDERLKSAVEFVNSYCSNSQNLKEG